MSATETRSYRRTVTVGKARALRKRSVGATSGRIVEKKDGAPALVKSLVQRLNEPLLAGHYALPGSRSPLRLAGPRKVRLAGPSQPLAVMQVEMGSESGTTYVSCWPYLVDLFGTLSDSACSKANDYPFNSG